ncbi:hypothetical protein P3T36_005455 [Kitasatospora sp. MAP12-15]|uniref:DUF3592 domain-containing protein n=1 Tax=unclassified Kitasatospora TaxID=2633591 RepID=UPI002474DF81|nr:DUF3592 domain-containing protein [Kitasatospora sp. MAP12-44]MDH6108553.1 hypothetical protein [Kitasatospora sp. MAP12-44]
MSLSIVAVPAVWAAVGGLVAYLAGVTGLNATRRLLRDGIPVQALVKERPADRAESAGVSRPLLQFATREGLVMEVFSPVCSSRSHPLVDGRHVLVRYDPDDPRQVLVQGRERRGIEYAFVALGAGAVLTGLVLLLAGG